MINSDDFVEQFISECIAKGVTSQKLICEIAQKEMIEIDEKLRESNLLRIRYKNLRDVLKNFNHESLKKIKNNAISSFNEIGNIKESPYYDSLIKICAFIDFSKDIVTSREIMDKFGNRENSQEIYGLIKTLADHGIISRNENRHIIKGPKWDSRPQEEKLINNSA